MKCPICDGMGTSNTCVNGTFKPCSFCNGTSEVMTDDIKIKCDDCKFVENCVDYGWQDCKKFTQKPSEPQTEQEYLQTCNTEQLAEFLIASIKKCKFCASGIGFNEVQHCPFGECGCHFKGKVVAWLKQPHKGD